VSLPAVEVRLAPPLPQTLPTPPIDEAESRPDGFCVYRPPLAHPGERLHTEIANYLRQPDVNKRITAMGADIDIETTDEMRKIIPAEMAKWEKVARASGMPKE